jgi:hypothetical protein
MWVLGPAWQGFAEEFPGNHIWSAAGDEAEKGLHKKVGWIVHVLWLLGLFVFLYVRIVVCCCKYVNTARDLRRAAHKRFYGFGWFF